MHTMAILVQYKQKQVLNCQSILHRQAIYYTWGSRMSSSTWHKSDIHCISVADTAGLLCNKRLALKTHTRKCIHLDKHTTKTLKSLLPQIWSQPSPFPIHETQFLNSKQLFYPLHCIYRVNYPYTLICMKNTRHLLELLTCG